MIRQAVDSSNLKSIGYDAATKVLEIEFKYGGKIYHYSGVPAEEYEALMAAESKGKYLAAHIKNTYEYELVETSEE